MKTQGDFFEESIAKAYRRYQELLSENNAVDYADPEWLLVCSQSSNQYRDKLNVRDFTEMQQAIDVAQAQLKQTELRMFDTVHLST